MKSFNMIKKMLFYFSILGFLFSLISCKSQFAMTFPSVTQDSTYQAVTLMVNKNRMVLNATEPSNKTAKSVQIKYKAIGKASGKTSPRTIPPWSIDGNCEPLQFNYKIDNPVDTKIFETLFGQSENFKLSLNSYAQTVDHAIIYDISFRENFKEATIELRWDSIGVYNIDSQ